MKQLLFFLFPVLLYAQPNCNAFLYSGDTLQYKACKVAEDVNKHHYQFAREFQEKYDEALSICPYFAYAYQEKSVAYLKSGDFLTWKALIDKAVHYNPKGVLGYRGWCRYQFFRDYKGAIADIEKLDSLVNYNIGFSSDGDYHLNIAKAVCYSALGEKTKAISIIEKQMKDKEHFVGLFDYFQLGVLYFEVGNYSKALTAFEKQTKANTLADNEYYKARIYKLKNNSELYQKHKTAALQLYTENRKLFNPYTHHFNKVFLEEIEQL